MMYKGNSINNADYLISDNKLILKYYENDNILIIIDIKIDNNEFIPQLLLNFDDSEKMNTFIEEVKKLGINKIISELNLTENKTKSYSKIGYAKTCVGTAYQLKNLNNNNFPLSSSHIEKIKTLIKIYLFNKDLKAKILSSRRDAKLKGNENYRSIELNNKYYLINKEWMNKYKQNYLYTELFSILEDFYKNEKNYDNNTNIENTLFIYIEKKPNFLKQFSSSTNAMIEEKLLTVKKNEIRENIYYYNEFIIINEDIYKRIIIDNNKNIYNEKETKCMTNGGKIILLINENKIYQILIGKLNEINDECNVIPEILINFYNNTDLIENWEHIIITYIDSYIDLLKKNKLRILNKTAKKEIGKAYDLLNKNNLYNDNIDNGEENGIEDIQNFNNNKNIILLLIELYFNFRQFNHLIRNSTIKKDEDNNYYLINRDWKKLFNEYYNYEEITKLISEKDNIKNMLMDFIKNKENSLNKDLLNNEINQNFPKEIIKKIIKKPKDNNMENILEIIPKETDIEKSKIDYFDNFLIINEKIKNIFESFSLKLDYKLNNLLIEKNNCFVFYALNTHNIICFGILNNTIFESNILIYFNRNYYFNNYFERIIKIGISETLKKINFKSENSIKIKKDGREIGIAYKLNKEYDNSMNKSQINLQFNSIYNLKGYNEMRLDTNNNNIKNKNIENLQHEFIERVLKALIKYYLLNKRIREITKLNNKEEILYQKNKKYYLINSKWMKELKNHYSYEKLIISIKNKNIVITPINNNIINYDDNTINYIYKEILKNLSDEYNNNKKDMNEKYDNEYAFEVEIEIIKDYNIKYPNNFEIVDENIYNNLVEGTSLKTKYLDNEIIFNNNKIIIKINNPQDKNNNNKFIILIGNLKYDNYSHIFICEYLLEFSDGIHMENIFQNLVHPNSLDLINEGNKYIQNIFKIDGNKQSKVNKIIYEENDKHSLGMKMMKLFLILHIYYEQLNENIKKPLKSNKAGYYYLVNKNWMQKYKSFYKYQKISDKIRNTQEIIKIYPEYKKKIIESIEKREDYDEYVYEIIKYIPNKYINILENNMKNEKDLIKELSINENNKIIGKFSVNELNCLSRNGHNLKYYDDNNEILSNNLINLFAELENKELSISMNFVLVKCLIGEEKFFIIKEHQNCPLITIGHLINNIVITESVIYFHKIHELQKFLLDINNESFTKYIEKNKNNLKIINIEKNEQKNNFIKNIFSNKDIPKINDDSLKLLKLFIYYNNFINEIKNLSKNKKMYIGYFVKNEFFVKNKNLEDYKIIEKYLSKKEIINHIQDNDEFFNKILNEFDEKSINDININKNEKYSCSNNFICEFLQLKISENNYIDYINDFFILNKENYDLFKGFSMKFWEKIMEFKYFIIANNLFILIDRNRNNSVLEVCKIKSNYEFEIDLILNYEDSQKREEAIDYIMNNGYKDYINLLLFNEDHLSPIFDKNQKIIGNAYKYDKSINDYSIYNINLEIRKLFLLYMHYKQLNNKLSNNYSNYINNDNIDVNNLFDEYYIINKDWILEYKKYYNFDQISSELNKIPLSQQIFNNIKEDQKNIENSITDKKLILIIKKLSKNIVKDFNEKEKNFNINYKNNNIKSPELLGFEYFKPNNQKNQLLYYNNFEILSFSLYNYLFSSLDIKFGTFLQGGRESISIENQFSVEKVECMFDCNRIIIKFENNTSPFLEVGTLNNKNVFIPECFLIYNNNNYLENHVKSILKSGGFYSYCENFKNYANDILEIKDNNNLNIGLTIKITKTNKDKIFQNIQNNNIINQNDNIFYKQSNLENEKQIKKEYNISKKNVNNLKGNLGNVGKDIINSDQQRDMINSKIFRNSIKHNFTLPPKMGLMNIGSTCYMNATLQCFCQIEEFASYFKYDNYINKISNKFKKEGKPCLTSSFKILIDNIWPNDKYHKNYYEPRDFKDKISVMDPLFQSYSAKDAKDLVNFIIMTLHSELNKSVLDTNYNNLNNNLTFDQRNKESTFKAFYLNYITKFCSQISKLFYAIQQTENTCLNCKTKQYNFQTYFFLIFPLEKVKEYALDSINTQKESGLANIIYNNMFNNMNMFNMNNNMLNNMNNNMNNNIMFNNMNNNISNNIMFNDMNNNMFNNYNNMMNNNILFNNINNNIFLNSSPNMICNMMNNNIFNNINNNSNNFMLSNNNNSMFNMPYNMSNNNNNIMSNMPNNKINNMNEKEQKIFKLKGDIVNIEDCFNYIQKTDLFTGNNAIYCNYCQQLSPANYCSTLLTAPKILILLLNRGKGIEFKIKLEFTELLDLNPYINSLDNNKNNNNTYKLIGVITHLGNSGEDGHFIAHCLSPIDNKWYTYNDATVNETEDFKRIIDLGMPYLLFYQRESDQ